MDAAEIVIHKPKRDRSRVILNFLREGVRQPRKAANAHPHLSHYPKSAKGGTAEGVPYPKPFSRRLGG
jgi:hypothetical protein